MISSQHSCSSLSHLLLTHTLCCTLAMPGKEKFSSFQTTWHGLDDVSSTSPTKQGPRFPWAVVSWLAPPCPNRAQGLSGRWFCTTTLSYSRGHSGSHRAETISSQHPESQPDTFIYDVASVLPKCHNPSSPALPQVCCVLLTANGMWWWGPTRYRCLSLDLVSLSWRP